MLRNAIRLVLLVSLTLMPVAAAAQEEDAVEVFDVIDAATTVTGGLRAPAGSFPSVVRLSIKPHQGDNGLCTGALIHESLVLTAAHCVVRDGYEPKWIMVTWGETEKGKGGRSSTVYSKDKGWIVHPEYGSGAPGSDLAVIRLQKPVPASQATPSRLATKNAIKNGYQYPVLSGWGTAIVNDVLKISRHLLFGGVRLNAGSRYTDATFVTQGDATIGDWSGPVVTCFGDSGGPVFLAKIDGATSKDELANIVQIGVNASIWTNAAVKATAKAEGWTKDDARYCMAPGIGSRAVGIINAYDTFILPSAKSLGIALAAP